MMRRFAVAIGVSFVATIAACVIGPKQDDPFTSNDETPADANTAGDGGFTTDDTASDPTTTPEAGAAGDAAADVLTDVRSETCPDGGTALEAVGPWHDGKKCWRGIVFFECVSAIDGGTAFTCFARVSTGELFLAATTHLPSGTDYRACTDEERARVKMSPDFCGK